MFKSEKGRQVDEILLCRGGMASHLTTFYNYNLPASFGVHRARKPSLENGVVYCLHTQLSDGLQKVQSDLHCW